MDYNSQYRLALVVGGLVFSGVLLPATYYLKNGGFGSEGVERVCSTKACKETAKRILDYMDPSVDKCQNFYNYACGKFLKTAKIPEDQRFVSSVTEVNLKLSQKLKGLLEKKSKKDDPSCFKTVRQLYSLCMDEKKIETQGLQPIKDFLKKAGGWPVLDPNWDPIGWDVSQTILQLRSLGGDANGLFKLVLVEDNGKLTIHVDKPDLRLPPDSILKGPANPIVYLHYNYMQEIAILLGTNPDEAEKDMSDVLQLERYLATEIQESQLARGSRMLAFSVADLESRVPFFNWKTLHGAIPTSYPNRDEKIVIYDVDYLHALGKTILPQFDSRTIMNYLMWHAIFGMTQLLDEKARERELFFKKELSGVAAREPRWRECVKVANKMTYALSALYIREYYGDEVKTAANGIAKSLHEELKDTIQQLDWMDKDTKKEADSKASNMALNIGFTETLRLDDLSKVEENYEGLKIDQNNYFQAVVDFEKWKINRGQNYEALTTEDSGLDDMTEAKAFYLNMMNSLYVPASSLQPPYFTAGAPHYVNYATLGHLMGHEMTHGFDAKGSRYGPDGFKTDWWNKNSYAAFVKKSGCMVKQFNKFVESQTQLSLDGINTINENIADSGGMKLAYRAYKQLETTLTKPQQEMPGLQEFNKDQLFFLAIGNQLCTAYRPQVLRQVIARDDHAPEEFRLNGALINLPEFGAVFGCGPGTAMNPDPKDRCEVW